MRLLKQKEDKIQGLSEKRKEIVRTALFAVIFTGIFLLYFYDTTDYNRIANYVIFVLIVTILLGVYTYINCKTKLFLAFKGIIWIFISLVFLGFNLTILYGYMKFKSVIPMITLIFIYLIAFLINYYIIKKTLLNNSNIESARNNKITNSIISVGTFGYVLFYILAKNLDTKITYTILASFLYYLSLHFIFIGIFSLYYGTKIKEINN